MSLQLLLIFVGIFILFAGLFYIESSWRKGVSNGKEISALIKTCIFQLLVLWTTLILGYFFFYVQTDNPNNFSESIPVEQTSTYQYFDKVEDEKPISALKEDAEAKKDKYLKEVQENDLESSQQEADDYIQKAIERANKK